MYALRQISGHTATLNDQQFTTRLKRTSHNRNVPQPTGVGCVCGILALLLLISSIQSVNAQPSPSKPKQLATNLKGFGIPFRINASDESFIEVQLYLSTDQGKTWRFHDRQSTDKAEFPFQAQGDGEYWFAIKTLNRNRQLIPEGKPNAELIIIVDTELPELSFDVSADAAGRIECRWKATDKNLKADSVQLAYQPIGAAPDDWKIVPVNLTGSVRNGSYSDQIAWWPETTERSLNVRVSISDTAGNTVYQERRINIAQSPWRHRNQATARTGDAISSGQILTSPASPESNSPPVFPFPDAADAYTQRSVPKTSPSEVAANSEAQQIACENGVCSVVPPGNPQRQMLEPHESWRVAGGTQLGHEPVLVGSPPVISEPPHPDLYGAVADNRSNPTYAAPPANRPSNSGGVAWESETERWTTKTQSTGSTVRSPSINQGITPELPTSQRDNLSLPNPNPNRIIRTEQTVVGESSTSSPNQYRGLGQQSQSIAPPEFLAGEEASNWAAIGESGTPGVGAPGTDTPQEFHSTGFQPQQFHSNSSANPNREFAGNSSADSSHAPPDRPHETGNTNRLSDSRSLQANAAGHGFRRDEPGSVMEQPAPFDASVQMIPSKRFRLNYSIDAIDPSGVARVDLWMTRDGGRVWRSWGTDPDNRSPFPVEVDEEGSYGFRIVIHSKDGLTGRAPSNGDKPDIFVQVDTQAPLVQIISVPYGRGDDAGRLIINYRVTDPHLTLRPISLYYGQSPNGPWTPIEEGLRNEGRYVWKPASNVPDRVFLRLDAMDRATNKGTHILSQAIDVSGLVPRGTIQGVMPVGGR
jgi:hypothetical protein